MKRRGSSFPCSFKRFQNNRGIGTVMERGLHVIMMFHVLHCTFFGLELEFVWILLSPLCPIRFGVFSWQLSLCVKCRRNTNQKPPFFSSHFECYLLRELEIENSPDSIHIQIHKQIIRSKYTYVSTTSNYLLKFE